MKLHYIHNIKSVRSRQLLLPLIMLLLTVYLLQAEERYKTYNPDCIASESSGFSIANNPPLCSHPDFDALMALYNSTNGANWTNNTGWVDGAAGTDCDPCGWYGIECDGDGRVDSLNLRANQLNGCIPPELGDLSNLFKAVNGYKRSEFYRHEDWGCTPNLTFHSLILPHSN